MPSFQGYVHYDLVHLISRTNVDAHTRKLWRDLVGQAPGMRVPTRAERVVAVRRLSNIESFLKESVI